MESKYTNNQFEYVKEDWADELKEPREGDVGYDLYIYKLSKITENGVRLYDTGVKVKPPDGYYIDFVIRSSFPLKTGYMQANSFGVIDPNYRENIKLAVVPIFNPQTTPALKTNEKLYISGDMKGLENDIMINKKKYNVKNISVNFKGNGRCIMQNEVYYKRGLFDVQGIYDFKLYFELNGEKKVLNSKEVDMRLHNMKFVDGVLVSNVSVYFKSNFFENNVESEIEYRSDFIGTFECDISNIRSMLKIIPPEPIKLPLKAAQMIFRPIVKPKLKMVKSLNNTNRCGGFGSTDNTEN
jgi:dUTPase